MAAILPAYADIHGDFVPAAPVSPSMQAISQTAAKPPISPIVGKAVSGTGLLPATSLGTALVFIRPVDLNPATLANLQQIRQIHHLTSTFYLADNATDTGHGDLKNVEFIRDINNQQAKAYQAKPNTIVFRDTLGFVRVYNLQTEYPAFLSQIRAVGGEN